MEGLGTRFQAFARFNTYFANFTPTLPENG